VTRSLGAIVYVLVVGAGLFGVQSPFKNVAPLLVWALWWVGLSYVCAFVANAWLLLHPLDGLFRWGHSLWAKLRGLGQERPRAPSSGRSATALPRPYPEWLGAWPAVLLFVVFLWMEIVWEGSDRPAHVASALLGYAGLTWLGMALFGRRTWLRHGEVFTLIFGLLARFAPIHLRLARAADGSEGLSVQVRPYAVGLLVREPLDRSQVALVMVLLSSVSFDGFVETPAWAALASLTDHPVLVKSLALLVAPCLFLAVFLLVCRWSVQMAHGAAVNEPLRVSTWRTAGLFATTLVPIAIAYHLAHYLSFIVLAGQYLVPLASDPMGFGWDLFGTVHHFVRPGLIDARIVWNVSVAAIVIGHVIAVYLAHAQAVQAFADRRAALRSQYPMLALMVGYTMLSLWIIAQPIVTSR
jgi:hypothetical protein